MNKIFLRFAALMACITLSATAQADADGRRIRLTEHPLRDAVSRYASQPTDIVSGTADLRGQLYNRRHNTLISPALSRDMTIAPSFKQGGKIHNAKEPLPVLYGYLISSASWDGNENFGIYSVPKSSGETPSMIYATDPEADVFSATLAGETYYVCEFADFSDFMPGLCYTYFTAYDPSTGEKLYNASVADDRYVALSMTYDNTTSSLYGVCLNEDYSGYDLVTFEVARRYLKKNLIGAFTAKSCTALSVDSNGQLYAIDSENNLYKVDKTSGACTLVGPTGIDNQYLVGAVIDPATDRMYWAACSDMGSGLCEVDTATGEASIITSFSEPQEFVGLYIPSENGDAPARLENLEADFPEGSLSGTVSFTTPATLVNGTNGNGQLKYTVLTNGEMTAEGTAAYGSRVDVPVTVPAPGTYEFSAFASNDAGDGAKTITQLFVGPGQLAAPVPVVTFDYATSTASVTWAPVTSSVNGGYINPSEVIYDVTRLPDAIPVAEGISNNSFTEIFPVDGQLTLHHYSVVARWDNSISAPGTTAAFAVGAANPPYSNDFINGMDGFTALDSNGDGHTWSAENGCARVFYNSSIPMDDWLFSVGIRLTKGLAYRLGFDAFAVNMFPERFEVKYGILPLPGEMTSTVIPATVTTASSDSPDHISGYIVPEEDGIYYIGIHGISDPDSYLLNIDNFMIDDDQNAAIPAGVNDLAATVDVATHDVTLRFTAPTLDVAGRPLSSLTRIDIFRDDNRVEYISNPDMGTALSFTDSPKKSAEYTYKVVTVNEFGTGAEVYLTVYSGIDFPLAPDNVTAIESASALGNVDLSWAPVVTDRSGNAIPSGMVSYSVYTVSGGNMSLVARDIESAEYSCAPIDDDSQAFVQFAVMARTDRGEGNPSMSEMIAVGRPYNGIHESFPEGSLSHIWSINQDGGGSWRVTNDAVGIPSQDGDNGFIAMTGGAVGHTGELCSGKIALTSMDNPCLTFYTYNIVPNGGSPTDDINLIQVSAREPGGEFHTLKSVTPASLTDREGWAKCIIPLDDFAGKTVQIRFTVTVLAVANTFIDNIEVASLIADDLAVTDIKAPAAAKAGNDFNVQATITNEGASTASGWSVNLYADGTKIATTTGTDLEPGARTSVDFSISMPAIAAEPVMLRAEVSFSADLNPVNNSSETLSVTPVLSDLPAIDNLKAVADGSNIVLSWSEPDIPQDGDTLVTESFEDAESYSLEYPDWTFIDEDKSPAGGFQGLNIPGVTFGQTPLAFFILDSEGQNFVKPADGHSGTKSLASLLRFDDGVASDWAISPELPGIAQKITFFARSYDSMFPEKIEVLYSLGSAPDIENFTVAMEPTVVPGEWTMFTADIPEGSTRFAIHSCARGAFMLMIDDITFISKGQNASLELIGYNVYRDKVKITPAPITSTRFIDPAPDSDEHAYVVTAIFNDGESRASNEVVASLQQSSVDRIHNDINIATGDGCIIVTGLNGTKALVMATDGKVIHTFSGDGTVSISPGIYIVKAAATVRKVIVR